MKQLLSLLTFCLVSCFPLVAQSGQKTDSGMTSSNIELTPHIINIGETPFHRDSTYLYKFAFKSTGSEPLVIAKAIAACPCVSIKYPDYPIPPGQVDTIFVYFTSTRAGRFSQRIAVLTNSEESPLLQLYAKATFLKPSEIKARKQQ
jgi:hypothetical protein